MEKPNITMVPVPKKKGGFRGRHAKLALDRGDRAEQVMNMLRSGMSMKRVSEEMGMTKQSVSAHFKRGLALVWQSTVQSRLDLLVTETEKLESIREAYMAKAIDGDIPSAGVVLKVGEKIASLWALGSPDLIAQLPTEKKTKEDKVVGVKDIVREHLDLRLIDTKNGLWAEISPSVCEHLKDKSIEDHAKYISTLAIPMIPEAVVPIRKSLPEYTGAGDFKGIFTQSGAEFDIVENINNFDTDDIINKVNKILGNEVSE